MKKLITVCFFLILANSNAQDIFKESLYSADLVMSSKELISLTDQQAERIKKVHSQNASEFRSLHWELENENAKLKSMLSAQKVDQAIVDKQMDLVLSLENQLKKKQLKTLITIKNELTESQQAELDILKYTPPSFTKFGGAMTEKSNKSDQGSKNTMSVISSGDQPIFIIKQGDKEKKVLSVDKDAIDSNKINKVEVIKGNTAWELYGEEGKNGVVIITLKKDFDYQFE